MGTEDTTKRPDGDLSGLWRRVGEALVRGQGRVDARFDLLDARFDGIDARFDRVEGRLDRVESRLDSIDTRLDGIDTRLDSMDARFDGMDARFDRLEGDVAATKEQLGRLERATASGFSRVDAQLERLITLVQRAETRTS